MTDANKVMAGGLRGKARKGGTWEAIESLLAAKGAMTVAQVAAETGFDSETVAVALATRCKSVRDVQRRPHGIWRGRATYLYWLSDRFGDPEDWPEVECG